MKQLGDILGINLLRRISWKARVAIFVACLALMAVTADNAPFWFTLAAMLVYVAAVIIAAENLPHIKEGEDDE